MFNIKGRVSYGYSGSEYDYHITIAGHKNMRRFEDVIIKPYVNIVTMERKVPETILETCCNRSED